MIDLEPSPEQAAFRDEVRAFIDARLPDEIRHCLRRIHALDQWFGDADAQAARSAAMGA
ncbi:MAG: hypothetical protein LCI02_24405 [Proteobacteria bacterium]|nr:hypothetical protein [Pseudomonadota bacterium]